MYDPQNLSPISPKPLQSQKPRGGIGYVFGWLGLIPFLGIPAALITLALAFTRKSKTLLIMGSLGILFTLFIFFSFKFHWISFSQPYKKNPPNASEASKIINKYIVPYLNNYCPENERYLQLKPALESPASVCELDVMIDDPSSPTRKVPYDNRLDNPDDLKKFTDLKVLRISLDTSNFPSQILELKSVEVLIIRTDSIEQLPDFSSLSNLQRLEINSSRKFPALPKGLSKIKNLHFEGGGSVSPTINTDLTNLEALEVINSKFPVKEIIPILPRLKNLRILNLPLTEMHLTEKLPQEIFEVPTLQSLSLGTELKDFPSELSRLKNLKYLYIFGEFTEVPDSISQFANLEVLVIPGNINKISDKIRNLNNLKVLDIRGSPISDDQKSVQELDKLLPNTRLETTSHPIT
ncbi:MAG: hypothetical protein A2113_01010 [Candidatus Woykebacteria bacterium GWA1_44_8]|uniref:Disease resistance R13L4/SHOC-2-like LRR domain-containing protein n=1 Tax=Candidatus Woykebacteria bacterium GWA1_44_8 TaxID=1802591 RepID=A0A1G1W2R9_9BACT|nr:MAG: hypothetical protein A2113_01010 [Candidatus Woykebacteria bacterium GWA1_44_8]